MVTNFMVLLICACDVCVCVDVCVREREGINPKIQMKKAVCLPCEARLHNQF